jgi:hypothetical protein
MSDWKVLQFYSMKYLSVLKMNKFMLAGFQIMPDVLDL